MAIIKRLIEKRRKRLEEEAATQSEFEFRYKTNLPEKDKKVFARGYEIAYINGENRYRNARISEFLWRAIIIFPLMVTLMYRDLETHKKNYPAREQRIIEFYEKYGSCPNDANSVYLEDRKQKWKEEVETKK